MDDISNILVEASADEDSLNDISWWKEGLNGLGVTVDISEVKEQNNIKPELDYQWNNGGDYDFDDTSAGDVQRKPRIDEQKPKKVIHFARVLMNRGMPFRKVAACIKERFAQDEINAAQNGLRKIAAYDGLIGRVIVDAHGYASCKDAVRDASKSPWKGFIKYIAGCNCGDHIHSVENVASQSVEEGGTIDGILNEGVKVASSNFVERCASTRYRISTVEGLNPADVDSTILGLYNMGYLSQDKMNEIQSSDMSGTSKVKEAFKVVDNTMEQNENSKYETNVDPEEYKVENNTDIELNPVMEFHNDDIDMGEVENEVTFDSVDSGEVEFGEEQQEEFAGDGEIELDDVSENQSDDTVVHANSVDFDI